MAKKVQNTVKRNKPRTRKGKGRKKKEIKITTWMIIIICIILGLCIILPYLSERPFPDKGTAVPEGSYTYGIDISHYQTDVVWDSLMVLTDVSGKTIKSKLKARDIKPVSFVFIKATEGSTMKDKHFRKHWKKAGVNAVRRGAYHFFRSSKDAEAQARNFIKTVGELEATDLPPVLDIETIHKGCSHKALNDKALLWLKTIEEHYGRNTVDSLFIRIVHRGYTLQRDQEQLPHLGGTLQNRQAQMCKMEDMAVYRPSYSIWSRRLC